MTRTKRSTLTFRRAFTLEGADRSFPAGAYELVTDEELIEGLSFPSPSPHVYSPISCTFWKGLN